MADYRLIELRKGDFQDNHGNWWCDVSFEGVSEPVKWVIKDPLKITEGEVYQGEIKEQTSKAGKPYQRFYRSFDDNKTSNFGSSSGSPKQDDGYWEDKNAAIKAQWAIGQAVSHLGQKDNVKLEQVETLAKALYDMSERVKEHGLKTTTKPVEKEVPESQSEIDSLVSQGASITQDYLSDIPF